MSVSVFWWGGGGGFGAVADGGGGGGGDVGGIGDFGRQVDAQPALLGGYADEGGAVEDVCDIGGAGLGVCLRCWPR